MNIVYKLLFIVFICINTIYANDINDTKIECAPTNNDISLKQSIKWYRDSSERNAIYSQTYSMATNFIKSWVHKNKPSRYSWGVIVDIDETTLDNSWYFIQCGDVNNENDFSHYVAIQEKSTALTGVRDFVGYVHQMGGYVSLVSNRDGLYVDSTGNVLQSTINNLKSQNIYFDQVLLAKYKDNPHPTDKNMRFNAVINGKYDANYMVWSNKLPSHKVITFIGDNIQDFPVFKQSTSINNPDMKQYNKFGNGYFILPNPMYGSWEANSYK